MAKSRRLVAIVVLAVLCLVACLLQFTDNGVRIQWRVAQYLGWPPYLRLVSHRVAQFDDSMAVCLAAEELLDTGFDDLNAARNAVDRAIRMHPGVSRYYSVRGRINIATGRYAEAEADFAAAVLCWRTSYTNPSEVYLSNYLRQAVLCREAKAEAWSRK